MVMHIEMKEKNNDWLPAAGEKSQEAVSLESVLHGLGRWELSIWGALRLY